MSPAGRASVEADVLGLLEDIEHEDALAVLGAVKGRIQARMFASQLPQTPEPKDQLLTAKEAAQRLGVSVKTVYSKKDQLGAVPVGSRSVRFPASAIERAMQNGLT